MIKGPTLIVVVLILLSYDVHSQSLRPQVPNEQDTFYLTKGPLKATFVNNEAFGVQHKAGYNGIAALVHYDQDSSPFVPFYAGFNLEHIFGGDSLFQLFEPRRHPMELYRDSEDQVLLYQAPTPLSNVESLTSFTMSGSHYIDIVFECIVHDTSFFKHDYAGFFWASYIHAPPDKKIYFQGSVKDNADEQWIAAYSNRHGDHSTHVGEDDQREIYFAPNFNASLASHFSRYQYSFPFYYGLFHNMVVGYFFDSDEIIRFSQSPTGGGENNPAWDFQYIIPNVKPDKIYAFRARMLYKPFGGAEDVQREFDSWKAGLEP